MAFVEPYQFEPEIKKKTTKKPSESEDSDDEWETIDQWDVTEEETGESNENIEEDEDLEARLEVMNRLEAKESFWCKCRKCVKMCVNRVDCRTEQDSFDAVCLNKDVLWTALVSLNDRECAWLPPKDNVPNSYRYASYRQICWFIYAKLGRYVRRIIPSCVITKIRATFPEPNGVYTNFEGDDEGAHAISEVVQAWEFVEL